MAQLEEAAGEVNEPVDTPTDPIEDFADAIGLDDEGNIPDEDESEGEEAQAETPEEDEQEGEPEAPAIDPPVSWKADAKELFKTLPVEAQKVIADREAERERFVQTKAQEAAGTRSQVENEARQVIAQLQQQTADQLQQYAQLGIPSEPNPEQYPDWQSYSMAKRQYDGLIAQRQQAQQLADQYRQQAQQQQQAQLDAEMRADVQTLQTQFPEWFDPSSSADLQQKLTATARELGYSPEHVSQARAVDIMAMRKVSDIIAERDSLKAQIDTLNKQKMANVRAAKTLPKVAKPGVASGAPNKQQRADAAWQNVKNARSSEQRYGAFADFLDNAGML